MKTILLSLILVFSFGLFAQKTDVLVYPNPAKEVINISFDGVQQNNVSIVMLDILGNVVHKSQFKNNSVFTINLEDLNLSNGFYFIKIETNSNHYLKKIVIKN